MELTDWKIFLHSEQIPFEENINLKKKTWIHRGGKAHYFVTPTSLNQLFLLVKRLYEENQAFKIIGHTSNLYIRNTTDIDIVISTTHLNHFKEENNHYICECGVAIAELSRNAIKQGHSGYEGFINLPGTVASAAVNNAGCFGCGISDLLVEATVVCPDGKIRNYTKEQFVYSERSSAFKRGETLGVILQVILDCFKHESIEILQERAEANTQYRKTRQEGPKQNLGSTFPKYVMDAFYMNIPSHIRFLLRTTAKIYSLFGKRRPQSIVNTIILLCSGKYIKLHRYISKHNFGCFVWLDDKADDAFITYQSLIAKTSGLTDIEIEVI